MNILIVGGLGYVGGRFADYLLRQYPNYSIHLTTRKKVYPDWAKSRFEFHQLDLMETASINQCLSSLNPEIVFHLGALQQADCTKNEYLAHKINVEGTKHLIEDCQRHGVKKYIYLSTFQVYGHFRGIITEETPVSPQSVYARTKFEAEQIVRESSLKSLVIRLSNAYGYPMDNGVPPSVWTLVFNAFAKSAIEHQKIMVGSNQYRDFITLEDACRAIEHLTFKADTQWGEGLMNVGGNECLSVQQVAERVAKVYEQSHPGKKVAIEIPKTEEKFQPFQYNISRLMATGFALHGFRKEEIEKTFQLLLAHYG